MNASGTPKLLMVGSAGGHLWQLDLLASWAQEFETTWVTFDLPDARSRLEGRKVVWAHHPTTRNIPNLFRNMLLAWRMIRRDRPDLVVSCGAGVAVPFFVIARFFGIKTIFFEVYDRIDSPTLTARLCRPFATLMLAQWPEQQLLYPEAITVGTMA
jgi:UDP-N-acetylglucosamine:LPS N-acetylglucosamine transferase